MTSAESCRAILSHFVRAGAVLVAAVSVAVITSETFDSSLVTAWLPSLYAMKINTAYGFLAAVGGLWILRTCKPGSTQLRVARTLAIIVIAFGGLSLAEDLSGINLGVDQLILATSTHEPRGTYPGRMSPGAAFSLLFIGLALLAFRARRTKIAACAHWLIVPPLLVATLATIGYAYGVNALYALKPYTAMAATTAVSFLILGLSVLAADSGYGFSKVAGSDTFGGLVSRRLLPTLPGLLFLLGWACLKGHLLGAYDVRFALALMVLLGITVCIVAVASTAMTLHRVDLTRKRGETEILNLNAGLELRVQERTLQLAQVSSQLSLVNTSLEKLSRQDGLTGLANRRHFDAYLTEQIAIAHRYQRNLALVLCDVDSFKSYNDHYGHQAGDECLKRVAAALQSCCRRTADMAARYGGEEFALILPETGLVAAELIAEAAREAVTNMRIAHEKSPTAAYVSISGGIAVLLRGHNVSARQLIADADATLFQAKRLGRNRMVAMRPGAAAKAIAEGVT